MIQDQFVRGLSGAFAVLVTCCLACGTGASSEQLPPEPGSASAGGSGAKRAPLSWSVEVLDRRPHDTEAYTQGFSYREGVLYESTGTYGRSSLRRWRWEDGSVERNRALPADLFGEGLADLGDRLIQLTWRRGVAISYDPESLEETARHRYRGEGWGLAWDGERLYQSDGTHRLIVRAAEDFTELERLEVRREGQRQAQLNELEWVKGWLYANLYQTHNIAVIDPSDGRVAAVIDASGLLTEGELAAADVLNGIAYRPESETFLLTGKYWPWVFEVRIVDADGRTIDPAEALAASPSGERR